MSSANSEFGEELESLDTDEQLIAFVRSEEALWNHCSDAYRNRSLKVHLWNSIAIKTGDGKTALCCKTRWNTLRNSYVRKKKALVGKTGQARKKLESSGNFLLLTFLGDVPTVGMTSGNLDSEEGAVDSTAVTGTLDPSSIEGTPAFGNNQSPTTTINPSRPTNSGSSTVTYSANRNRKRPVDDVDRELVNLLKRPKVGEDEYHHFGLSIADQLRKMQPGFAAFVKMNITRIIYDCMYPPAPYQAPQPNYSENVVPYPPQPIFNENVAPYLPLVNDNVAPNLPLVNENLAPSQPLVSEPVASSQLLVSERAVPFQQTDVDTFENSNDKI